MADSDFVQAQVADLRTGRTAPPRMVVDANVLYWAFYPGFLRLGRAGGRMPQYYQRREYPRWVRRSLARGTEVFTSTTTLGEFIRLCEHADLELAWLARQPRPLAQSFSPALCKEERYGTTPANLLTCRQTVQMAVSLVLATVQLLPCWTRPQDEQTQSFLEWLGSAADAAYATLVANARLAGITAILSDDRDLMTFSGITLYTANNRAISAAGVAGKLI